jgi:RNA polymerase sigma-70 factor (ECF subfamily)
LEHNILADRIEKYHTTVFRVALGYVKNIQDAEDITQDVFFKLYKNYKKKLTHKDKDDEDEAVKAWLIRVTINESKNLIKSAWFRKRDDLASLDEGLVVPVASVDSDSDLGLYEYVKKLKPKYRTVIYLYYYEKYTAKEIAVLLKKPQSTIETQLRRSKQYLKEIIIRESQDSKKENYSYYGKV